MPALGHSLTTIRNMKTSFRLRNKTSRQAGCVLKIDPAKTNFGGWDTVRVYDTDEGEMIGKSEFVISYDASTLMNQFDITYKRAKALSDLFSDLV